MLLERLYNDLLAQGSYLLGSQSAKLAIIIDPNRDVDRYIEAAAREKLQIAYVTETHIHADFVSGARELAAKTGAQLLLSGEGGRDWQYAFASSAGARLLHDGDTIEVGPVRLDVRHTPGHTPEHLCFVVTDREASERPVGMFTGDFIFVGDVGRPDLLERAAKVTGTMKASARDLFRSLRATSDLPDYLQLWPGHGAGSACGKALGALPSTTLGYERLAGWAFNVADEAEFVRQVLADQPEPPRYFAVMKTVNRDGPAPVPPQHALRDLTLVELERALAGDAIVVDVRATADFALGHVPGAINLPLGSSFATWAGSLLAYDRDIVLLADEPRRVDRARHGLLLIGLDRVVATGGRALREAWRAKHGPLQTVRQLGVNQLSETSDRRVLDVRRATEWREGHMRNAEHFYLGDLVALSRDLHRDTPIAVHCQGGTRSAIAASLLQAEGFTNVANVAGGIQAWTEAGLPVDHS